MRRNPLSLAVHPTVELSKYELLNEIGHGGMATVYRARDPRLDREVAIKVIHRHLRESPEVGARFRSEALAVAKMKHPNIVEVYDVSSEDEVDKYLVVELIRGLTLRQLLRERGPLPPEVAACIAVEVSRALACAHREGVVHRDIKPENVLLSMDVESGSPTRRSSARVKLTDFGIAKLLDAQGVTHTGQVLGSPAHMAPEQIEGGDVDGRADIFGVGVLLYEMLTGVLPFEGNNPAQVLRKVLEGIFLPAERQLPRVGSSYGKIANQALSRDPNDRFSSAAKLADALEQELSVLGITDIRGEISRYLDDPEKFTVVHDETIPDLLSQCAAKARAEGEVFRAAALFNRALAYRPDDTELLAEVAGLARRGRFRRRLTSFFLLGLLVAGVLFALLHWGSQKLPVPLAKNKLKEKSEISGQSGVRTLPPAVAPAKVAPQVTTANEAAADLKAAKPDLATSVKARTPTKSTTPQVEPLGTRIVKTPVVGPQNASVRVDGNLLPWFERHELTLGPHTFEFVPPNSECCEASNPTTVTVVAGEGAQVVRGVIKFRDATLRLQAPDGSRASCGIGGVIVAGGSRRIPMNRASRKLDCTVFPPPGDAEQPKKMEADLRPGRTFTLTSS